MNDEVCDGDIQEVLNRRCADAAAGNGQLCCNDDQLVREPVICEFAEGWREAPVSAGMVEAFNDWRAKREQYWRANREQ